MIASLIVLERISCSNESYDVRFNARRNASYIRMSGDASDVYGRCLISGIGELGSWGMSGHRSGRKVHLTMKG